MKRALPTWLIVAVVIYAIAHQDFWYWDSDTILFGFMPIGLAYHALYSIAAATLWACAVKWAWPSDIEKWADEGGED